VHYHIIFKRKEKDFAFHQLAYYVSFLLLKEEKEKRFFRSC